MRRKIINVLISAVMLLVLAGCLDTGTQGSSATPDVTTPGSPTGPNNENTGSNSMVETSSEYERHTLVAYFSCTGNTEQIARWNRRWQMAIGSR